MKRSLFRKVEVFPKFVHQTPREDDQRRPEPLRSLKDLKSEATRYIEREAILHALKMTGWNKKRAARMLKISYKALFYKMDNYGIRNSIA